jgi:hypothetical protein
MDPYSLYKSVQPYRFGIEIEAASGTYFKENFNFLFTIYGPYGTVHTTDCGHGK